MKIEVKALIAAPIDVVWQAFNEPDDILRWDASAKWHTVSASNDLCNGGLLRLRIEAAHDDPGFDYVATYTRVEPMRTIEWQTPDHRQVRVEFAETDAGVVVRQVFDAEPDLSVDEQRADWQGILDGFARYAASIAG